MEKIVFWHRRDLRIEDNAGLYAALKEGSVQPVFIFDTNILEELPENDQRVLFIYREIEKLKAAYEKAGGDLVVLEGKPLEVLPGFCRKHKAAQVIANRDYEPYAHERDLKMQELLETHGIRFTSRKDQVIFEKSEVVKDDGTPYTVFTPYMKKWKACLNDFYIKPYPVGKYMHNLQKVGKPAKMISLRSLGFNEKEQVDFPSERIVSEKIERYDKTRDTPSIDGTSRLSLHLRFGTISIRKLVAKAKELNTVFLNELIWRDFYQAIVYHFPHSARDSFKREFDSIRWENNEEHFEAWKAGRTGYPLVDAGMRQLSQSGFMHNRVRMVTASFLSKHLLVDWRWGEAWFAEKLLDYDLAANVGGWQWAAGCGCDAAPYFRVFSPTAQQERFDKSFKYVKQWVPEFGTDEYPEPIVEHKFARERALERYREALKK
jgi:deoxyribodipyrimidine photo-lyase